MAEKIYRDEVLGGDGKRYYALVAPDGKVLLEKFSIEKDYEPQRQGSALCAEDVNAILGALGQKMEAGDFLAQASAKAGQADLQSAQAEAQKKLLRIQENLNARIFSNSLTAGEPGFNQWVYAQGEGGTQIPNAPESGTLWYEVLTGGTDHRAFQFAIGCFGHQRKVFVRFKHDTNWSGWIKICG